MAVENILTRVDIERGPGLLVQWAQSHPFRTTGWSPCPFLLPQILQQRQSPPQRFDAFVHNPFFASGTLVCGYSGSVPRQGWWAKRFFSRTQRPQNLQRRNHPRQRPCVRITLLSTFQPMSHPSHRLAKKGNGHMRNIQPPRPAANRGCIRHTISVLQLRLGLLPRTTLVKSMLQSLAPGKQTVVCVRKRKHRKKSEGCFAVRAAAPPDPDPVVILVMCLFPPPTVTHD